MYDLAYKLSIVYKYISHNLHLVEQKPQKEQLSQYINVPLGRGLVCLHLRVGWLVVLEARIDLLEPQVKVYAPLDMLQ